MSQTVVIVGGGQVGAVTARTLRRRGFDGRIVLVGQESHLPYQRPPLSKEYMRGEEERDSLDLLSADWCAGNDVELLLGETVTRVRGAEPAVQLASGASVPADHIVIATGGRPRRLRGVSGSRAHYLRTVDDADAIRKELAPGTRVIVVGAGFIGCEVASAARDIGAEATVLEEADQPMGRVLGADMGAACAELLRSSGARLHTGERLETYRETPEGVAVRTASGRTLEGDLLVVGAGMVPNVELLETSGLDVRGGVPVDASCRTGIPGVYAGGDVASQEHPLVGRRVRGEHFDTANRHGMAIAKNIVGRSTECDEPPWFWSDQFDRNLQHVGDTWDCDEVVIRGSVEEFDFLACYLRGGIVRAGFAMERGGDVAVLRELIARRSVTDPAALRDEDTDLADLLTE